MILEPGMEVECINDLVVLDHQIFRHFSGIVSGDKCIIAKVYPNAVWNNLPYVGVDLIGIDNGDTPLFAYRFRPIKKPKTDISVFKELLKEDELVG
jgi:hypothetical protein